MDMIYPNRTGFVFHVLDDNGRSGYARWVGNGQAGVAWDGGEFETVHVADVTVTLRNEVY